MLTKLHVAFPRRRASARVLIPATGLALLTLTACDLRHVQDEDLVLVREPIPASEDAWPLLTQAADAIRPARSAPDPAKPGLDRLIDDRMSAEELAPLVADNEEALSLLDRALERGRLSVPPGDDGLQSSFSLLDSRRLGDLLDAAERVALARGDGGEAITCAVRQFRLGRLLAGGRGPLIHYLIAASQLDRGIQAVARLRPEPIPLADRHRLLDALAPPPQTVWLQDALRAEYRYFAAVIDDPSLVGSRNERIGSELPYVYQKNRTKQMFADFYRQLIAAADVPFAEAGLPDVEPAATREKWRHYLSLLFPNSVGRITFSIASPSMTRMLAAKCRLHARMAATRAQVAADLYEAESGQKAPSLEALVPRYLEAVPVDDFDGRRIRYVGGVVYSVGEDLTDDGGDPEKDLAPFADSTRS